MLCPYKKKQTMVTKLGFNQGNFVVSVNNFHVWAQASSCVFK